MKITILNGRTVDYVEGKGAHVKNVSKVLEKDFYEYRRKGWLFTQQQGGSFRIGVPTKNVNEGLTFAKFLSNGSQITSKKEALAKLDEDMAFKPKNKTELSKLLKELIKERGDEGNFNDIDTSLIKDMSKLFQGHSSFNGDISEWNVSNVKTMLHMFYEATSFNQDISKWNVSNVTDMGGVFNGATSFNQDLSSWNVSNVTDMYGMFFGATSFNSDLSSWNVSNVKEMYGMFCEAKSFNQDLSSWDVSNVTDMSHMFLGATSFNQDLSSWDVSNVTNMTHMFNGATSFNQDLSSWDVSNVKNMSGCFKGTPIEDKAKKWFPTKKVNEGFTFASFLLNESQITSEKEALAELDEDEIELFDEVVKEAKKYGLEVKFSGENNGTGNVWGLYSAKHKEFVSKNYSVEALHSRVVYEGLDDYDPEKNEFTQ